jgi:hypothetical protein
MLAFSSVMKLIQKGCKVEIPSGLFSFPVFTLHRSGWHPESNSCSRRVSASKVLGRELHRYQQLPGQCVIIYLANCLRVIDVHHCHWLGPRCLGRSAPYEWYRIQSSICTKSPRRHFHGVGRPNYCLILPSQNKMCTTVRVLFQPCSPISMEMPASLILFERRKVTWKRTVTGGYDQSDLLPGAHLLK